MESSGKQLRRVRDALLQDMNNEVLKAYATNTPLSQAVQNYMQELRDLPTTLVVTLNDSGSIDWNIIQLPIKPTGET